MKILIFDINSIQRIEFEFNTLYQVDIKYIVFITIGYNVPSSSFTFFFNFKHELDTLYRVDVKNTSFFITIQYNVMSLYIVCV